MKWVVQGSAFINKDLPQTAVVGIGHGRMNRIMRFKGFVKSHLPLLGKINELIDDDKVSPANLLP
jgi:hypothetical protein